MKINWVLSDTVLVDPTIDIDLLKNIGPFWGGWQTWRSYNTDNVVCHDIARARNLINNNFHARCNLHVPAVAYQDLGRPTGVKLYQGEFVQMVDHPDDIVSMHLATGSSDIVLLLGFDLTQKAQIDDKLQMHKWHNYKNYVRQIITNSSAVQWVLLDQMSEIDKDLQNIPNLQFDTLKNILSQF
jgi:hypothetical protein